MKVRNIIIECELVHETQEVLRYELGVQEYNNRPVRSEDVLNTWHANFGDGVEVDIKLCNGESPYIDAVLFKDGCEVHVLEPSDLLLGDYDFTYKDEKYRVRVLSEPDADMRERMLDEIEKTVDGWNLNDLILFAKEIVREEAKEMSDAELVVHWENCTGKEAYELYEEEVES